MNTPKCKVLFGSIILFFIGIITLSHAFYSSKKSATRKALTPDIAFLIADLRWNNGSLKILEFGEGPQSYFQGFDELFGTGTIWKSFWKYLKPFKLPIWYVGKIPSTPKKMKQFAFDDFLSDGGRTIPSLEDLKHDPYFQHIVSKPATAHNRHHINHFRGILVFSNHDYPNWYAQSLIHFKKQYPDFLVINDAATPHVNHKYRTSLLFDNQLRVFRPSWIRCSKQYSSNLADQILQSLNTPIVVIKPLNSANGWGTIIVQAENLDETLKKIVTQKELLKTHSDPSWSHWAKDGHRHFLVEEFVSSHPVDFAGKQFDGTMRVVFILKYEQGNIDISYLGACWKLPKRSLDQTGSLMEHHKSGYGSAPVNPRDVEDVESVLNNLLPQLYKKMLQKKHSADYAHKQPLMDSSQAGHVSV